MSNNERERHAKRWAKVNAVVAQMKAAGWSPTRVRHEGNSVRFRCDIPGHGRSTVAIKTTGNGKGAWAGSVGFRQQQDGHWGSPMNDTDFLLFTTTHEGRLAVWKLSMPRVVERLEAVQQYYEARGRARSGALWMHIFAEPAHGGYAPCQLDLAEGAAPLWTLPIPWETEEGETPDEPEETIPPSPLGAFTVGQLLDELQRRGLKSFSF